MIGGNVEIAEGAKLVTIAQWALSQERKAGAQKDCWWTAVDTEVMTVMWGYKIDLSGYSDEDRALVDISDLYLTVEWQTGEFGRSCGIGMMSAELDLVQGAPVNFPASALTIKASYPLPVEPDNKVRAPVTVNAVIGKMPMSGGMCVPARRTISIGVVDAGDTSEFFPIPAFATSAVIVSDTAFSLGDFTLTQYPEAHATAAISASNTIGDRVVDQVPIANGARSFTVKNNISEGSSPNLKVMFFLSIGT